MPTPSPEPTLTERLTLVDRVAPFLDDPAVPLIQAHYREQMGRELAPEVVANALAQSAPTSPARVRSSARGHRQVELTLAILGIMVLGGLFLGARPHEAPTAAAPVTQALPVAQPDITTTLVMGPSVSAGKTGVATCPDGTQLVGGGYGLARLAGGANAPVVSMPSGHSWVITANQNEGTNQFQPFAQCAPPG